MSDELTIPAVPASTTVTPECDCYVHRFGSIAPGQRAGCCPSDMTDAEWAEVRSAVPVPAWLLKQGGRPEAYCHREMLDAVRYLVDNGMKWMAMPVDFPYWRAVYDFFRRWRTYDYVRELYERLRRSARERSGRNAEPSAGVIDSQSVDASETVGEDSRGYDGGKSRDGRKRHILTDTEGLLLEVTVTTADVHDSKAAPALLETFMDQPGRLLQLVWVDSAYQGPALAKAFARHGVRTEVVRRSDGQRGFVVLARRWVVERTLSWLSRSRRLNRDHERRPDHHAQMVWWAAVIRLSRRLAADAPRRPEKRPGRLLRARA
ncbi:IS5 family transposase [Streptomyces phaeolivaceus]|uniref:IS5 family transposase n=2 Tax=Streptomyces phaeolivaceus TaxID=2653200 RepID=A0A5P8K9J9_9ACTN|nr:IS5 family transposase [Streptomyces phaeolivaceus]